MGGLLHHLRHPRRCYLICAMARSGSNMLSDGLHETRRAGRPKQFFLPKFEQEYGQKHGLNAAADFPGYVKGVVTKTSTSNEVFGFKLMGWYLDDFLLRLRQARVFGDSAPSDLDMLDTAFPRLRFVQLLRRNKLRQAISKARAIQSGLWKVRQGEQHAEAPQFDPDLITRCLEDSERDGLVWERFFRRNAIQPFLVEYEDLCRDFSGTVSAVLDYLKIRLPKDQKIIAPKTICQTDSLSQEWEASYLASHPSARQFVTA